MGVLRLKNRRYRYEQIVVILVFTLACGISLSIYRQFLPGKHERQPVSPHHVSRNLLAEDLNCTPRAIGNFPLDPFTAEQRQHGAIVVHVFIACYMFLGFALLCDDYFVPSLEVLCTALNVKPDVAGATFMAAGSSAPELATAIIAVFIAEDDIGIGTVVGSAVYNVMFVISMCAIFAGMVVHLNWWPLMRDCLFYTLSVAALAIVIVDEKVFWYEATAFIVLYFLYILLMYYNTSLESWLVPKFTCCGTPPTPYETTTLIIGQNEHGSIRSTNEISSSKETSFSLSHEGSKLPSDSDFEDDDELETSTPLVKREPEDIEDDFPESVFALPGAWWKRVIYIWSLPLKVLFFISIPDCRARKRRWLFFITFFMSLVWLSALSYLMVWMITVIGYTAGIADTIMGLTFIAFGVSLPDVISSLLVVREGLGDMAVSNAVGSNVFDILICLGVPWLIQTFLKWDEPVIVYSQGLLYATITLLVTVVFLLVATHINKWRLTKKYGVVLMVVYIGFTALTALYELNIFGYVHPPECSYNY